MKYFFSKTSTYMQFIMTEFQRELIIWKWGKQRINRQQKQPV